MRLRDLDAKFLKREPEGGRETWRIVESIAEADGVEFLCPKCFAANSGPVGTHVCVCWQPHVPADIDPKPGRWSFQGRGLDDLTLMAGSSSVKLIGGCEAHFFIRNGGIVNS